jgi:hypothetical protein
VQCKLHGTFHGTTPVAMQFAYQLSEKQLIFDYLYSADYPGFMAIAADRQ